MKKQDFKINKQQPRTFDFKPVNHWRRLPWYFLAVIILLVIFISAGLYYQARVAANQIITDNQPVTEEVDNTAVVLGQFDENPFKDTVNILLLGNGGANHPGGGLTDVIQVLSINTRDDKALIFSIPRDLYVDIDGFGKHKINTAYVLGEQQGHGNGGKLAKKEVEQVLDIPIQYYIKIDFTGFIKIINLLQGIDICVEQPINDPKTNTYVKQGCQHMDGEVALDYVRSRYSTSDFDRSGRQQEVLMAIKEKTLKLNFLLNPLKLNQALNILVGHLNTDVELSEIGFFMALIRDLSNQKNTTYVLDNRKDKLLFSTIINGSYVLLPIGGKYDKIQSFVKKNLPK